MLALVLVWLCVANWRAVQNGDHALLLLSVFMLGYGLIEIVTFQFEHNFMWFYPLTATALAAVESRGKHDGGERDDQAKPGISEPSECSG